MVPLCRQISTLHRRCENILSECQGMQGIDIKHLNCILSHYKQSKSYKRYKTFRYKKNQKTVLPASHVNASSSKKFVPSGHAQLKPSGTNKQRWLQICPSVEHLFLTEKCKYILINRCFQMNMLPIHSDIKVFLNWSIYCKLFI